MTTTTTTEAVVLVKGAVIGKCACKRAIKHTGKRGRPATTCSVCRNRLLKARAQRRETRCVSCKRFLPKPKTVGRPAKSCAKCRGLAVAA